eukprot:SAG25_NODE_691_length_5916_cov_9.126698_6_plen_197_part_00
MILGRLRRFLPGPKSDSVENPLPPAGQPDDQWRREHRIESFPHTADVKNMPPPDPALRLFDPVRFDSELETRRTLSVVSGCLHEHYGKCQRQVDGKPVCKDRFKRACYTAEERANRANGIMSAAPVASECENSTESRVPLRCSIDANSVEVEMPTVEQASRHRYRRSGHIKAIALDHVYGHLHDWEFDYAWRAAAG